MSHTLINCEKLRELTFWPVVFTQNSANGLHGIVTSRSPNSVSNTGTTQMITAHVPLVQLGFPAVPICQTARSLLRWVERYVNQDGRRARQDL